ncbi:MAG: PAS domain S-box protein [Cyanobacteria bacterium RM1_2_2]|nr:PAS domain S-box protein [Cyanobacteria bacterium RM1_2_2]
MSKLKRHTWNYAAAVAFVVVALLFMLALDPYIQVSNTSFLLFFGATTLSAWFGGRGAGILSTLLSAILAQYFFIDPKFDLSVTFASASRVTIFLIQGCLISVLVGSLRLTQQRMKRTLREQEQVEAALRESEADFRSMFNITSVGKAQVDAQTRRLLRVNAAFCAITGYTEAELLTMTVDDLNHPDDYERDRERWFSLLRGTANDFQSEKRYVRKDGCTVWVLATGNIMRDQAGQPLRFVSVIQDITHRKQAESDLRQSEARLRMVANKLPNGAVFIVDHELRYQLAEGRALEEAGMTSEDFVGKTLWDALDPVLSAHYEPYYRQSLAGKPFSLEHHSHGRYYISHGTPLNNERGEIDAVLVVSYDITDRKQAEAALRQSEEQLRLATEGANLGMWFWDVATDTLTWTDRAKAMFGIPADTEMSMQVFLEAVHPDDRPLIETIISDLQVGQTHTEDEYRTRWPDGTVRWILARGNFTYDADGALASTRGVVMDITARKQAEEALAHSRRQFEKIAGATPDLVYVFDLKEGCNTYVNAGISRMLGYSPEQIAAFGSSLIASLIHPDDIPGVLEGNERFHELGDQDVYDHELRMRHAAGGYRWLRCRDTVFERAADGTVIKIIGTAQDVTDHKQVETVRLRLAEEREQLLVREQAAREAAEAASRIKDEFLAVVSHELRSPLNPILGWAKLLRTGQLNPQKTERALEVIERNAQMQAQLINDLLDVSRILRGKLSLENQPVELGSTIEAAMETVRLAAEAKAIDLQFTIVDVGYSKQPDRKQPDRKQPDKPTSPPATLYASPTLYASGDAGRLQQVVWNLLSNAVKFTPEGGRVEVQLEQVGGVGGEAPAYAQITVTDTGKGIPADFLPYVFDQFRQESSATTRRFGGLGLGLAIVRHLVELHGGTVQAASQGEGMGATFTVRLPLRDKGDEEMGRGGDSNIPSLPALLTNLRILVVDDDDNTREFLAFLLELHGAVAITVASASEAIATLTQFQPDVLLSDLGMPDVDGYMLLRQIRALPAEQGGTVPAIALTAYAGEIDYQQAMAVGFQRHIAKPIEPQVLIQAIADLTRQK